MKMQTSLEFPSSRSIDEAELLNVATVRQKKVRAMMGHGHMRHTAGVLNSHSH